MGERCIRSPIAGKDRCATCQRIHEHVTQPRDCTIVADFTAPWNPSGCSRGNVVPPLIGIRNMLYTMHVEDEAGIGKA